MLTTADNRLYAVSPGRMPIAVALVDPNRAAVILTSRGMTYTIAQMIADGALSGRESTTALARQRGLVQ
jgi:hypothetical protein